MSHLQLMQEAAPIFNANPDGGVYLITSSIAVSIVAMKVEMDAFVWLIHIAQGVSQSGSSMAYSVTKAAGLQLMRNLAYTQGPKIRVNAVLPGLLLTEWVCYYPDVLRRPASPIDAYQLAQGRLFPEEVIEGYKRISTLRDVV